MITLIAVSTTVLGYVAGRLHGRALHKAFMSRGWRVLQNLANGRLFTYSGTGHVWTTDELLQAFGSKRKSAR